MKLLAAACVFFFCFYSNICFAQPGFETKAPTLFDRFILNKDVDWAAYTSDTVRFKSVNFNALLRKRFEAEEIKVSLPLEVRATNVNSVNYAGKSNVLAALPPDLYFDSLAADLVEVNQILYVEKGRIKSHNAWVSPKYSVITPAGTRLGFANYFSTSFLEKPSTKKRSSKLLSLGKSSLTIYPDSIPKNQILKETYARNLIELIWPEVVAGNYKMVLDSTNTPVRGMPNAIQNDVDSVPVPLYDSVGNLISTRWWTYGIPISAIRGVMLEQEWYYDQKRNQLLSTVTAAQLFIDEKAAYREEKLPVFKILFQ